MNRTNADSGRTQHPLTGQALDRLLKALDNARPAMKQIAEALDEMPDKVHGDEWWCDIYGAANELALAIGPDPDLLEEAAEETEADSAE